MKNSDAESNRTEILELGASLRRIREQKKLTLRAVERESLGVWKAVVVGSYERGDRALTLKRAVGLAKFYGVPLEHLLGLSTQPVASEDDLRFDLGEIRRRWSSIPPEFNRFLQEICRMRSDWNGEVLSLRRDDQIALSALLNMERTDIHHWASSEKIVFEINR